MRIVIVARKDGKAVIRWPQYLGLSMAVSMVVALGTGAVVRLLSGQWSQPAMLFGFCIGVGIVGVGVINGLRAPPEKLITVV